MQLTDIANYYDHLWANFSHPNTTFRHQLFPPVGGRSIGTGSGLEGWASLRPIEASAGQSAPNRQHWSGVLLDPRL